MDNSNSKASRYARTDYLMNYSSVRYRRAMNLTIFAEYMRASVRGTLK